MPDVPDLMLDVSAEEARIWRERLADYFGILRERDRKMAPRMAAGDEGSDHP
jgi:hypothetical protein